MFAVNCIPPGPSDLEIPPLGISLGISSGPSDKEDSSLGVRDGGILG